MIRYSTDFLVLPEASSLLTKPNFAIQKRKANQFKILLRKISSILYKMLRICYLKKSASYIWTKLTSLYYCLAVSSLGCASVGSFSGRLAVTPTHFLQNYNEVLKKNLISSLHSLILSEASFEMLQGLLTVLEIKTNILRESSKALHLLVSTHQNSCRPSRGLAESLYKLFPLPLH